MLNRLIAIAAAAAMMASSSSAMAGLLGMPMNLKLSLESSHELTSTRIQLPRDACMVRTDDVLTGPVNAWVC